MKKDRIQQKFLEELEKTPIVSVACERVGISRNSVYRWRSEDIQFAILMEEALDFGINFVNDVAEGNVLNGIKKGDSGMTKYWLSSRHKAYKRPFTLISKDQLDTSEAQKLELLRVEKEIDEWEKRWEFDTHKITPTPKGEGRVNKQSRSTQKPSVASRKQTNQ